MKFFSCLIIFVVFCVLTVKSVPVSQDKVQEAPEIVCRQRMQRGQCRALIPRWSYDAAKGKCAEFKYGGCGGNGNNFRTRNECEATCLGV
ncbi:uncharacterized protein CBL_08754 [Carabus blaptoides fortunei]